MTLPIGHSPHTYSFHSLGSAFDSHRLRLGIACILLGIQPLLLATLNPSSPQQQSGTGLETVEIRQGKTVNGNAQFVMGDRDQFQYQHQAQTQVFPYQTARGDRQPVMPPDRGAPSYTVGSGSR